MSNIELVIKISEDSYKATCNECMLPPDVENVVNAIKNSTLLENNKCKWIRYDYRTMCPENHDIGNPYWRIPENRMDALKYCPYCGKEIELEEELKKYV